MVIAAAFGVAHAEKLTLDEAIGMAQVHSPEAQAAAHTYRAAYWSYRSFRANYLPEVNLVSLPEQANQPGDAARRNGTVLAPESVDYRFGNTGQPKRVVYGRQFVRADFLAADGRVGKSHRFV